MENGFSLLNQMTLK